MYCTIYIKQQTIRHDYAIDCNVSESNLFSKINNIHINFLLLQSFSNFYHLKMEKKLIPLKNMFNINNFIYI